MGANSFPILRQLSAHALHPAVGGTSMAALVCCFVFNVPGTVGKVSG